MVFLLLKINTSNMNVLGHMRTINTLLFCKLAVNLFWPIAFKQEKKWKPDHNPFLVTAKLCFKP